MMMNHNIKNQIIPIQMIKNKRDGSSYIKWLFILIKIEG
jgi:hypothetical protein